MLDVLRRGQRWIMPVILVGIGVPFAVYFGAQGATNSGPALASGTAIRLGERTISTLDVQRALEAQVQQYRQALGDQFDEKSALPYLVNTAASMMLRDALLAHLGEELGLSVSDAELQAFVARQAWSRGADGQYDAAQVKKVIEDNWGTEHAFARRLTDDLLASKTQRLIESSVAISDGEARDAIRYGREEVQLLVVRLDGTQPRAGIEVPEDAGKKLAAKDPERVRKAVEERRSELDTPEQVRARHEEVARRSGVSSSEQVRARHILVSLDPAADEATKAAARAKLDAAKKRIEAGEDFAAVAKEVSDDPGSKDSGGDLGFFKRGAMVGPFEEAAFSLEAGKLSDAVETPFGIHLIRVEEKQAASELPYSEASGRVAQELARIDASAAAAKADADAISAAVKAGKPLEEAAREKGAAILRPAPFRRRTDGFIPELGLAEELMNAAFALTKEKPSDGSVYSLGENLYALAALIEKKTPSTEEIDAALPLERERVLAERRTAVEQAWLEGERKRLEAAHCLGIPVATPYAELNPFAKRFCSTELVVDLSELLPESELAGAAQS
jgi:peptidyl-prolyl cis-trans isomerase D